MRRLGLVLAALFAAAPAVMPAQAVGSRLETGFPMRRLAGGADSLAGGRGTVRVVNLWATWCRPCLTELPSLAALADSVRGEPIRVYAVAIDAPDRVQAMAASLPATLPIFVELARFPRSWGRWALPTTYIIDGTDRLVAVHRGAARWDAPAVLAALRAVAAADAALGSR